MSGSEPLGPIVVGVTGNIASGKSTVSGRLAELGATVVDADRVYHELTSAPGSRLASLVADAFGRAVLNPDGSLDRNALGRIVFADPSRFDELDRVTHPAIDAEVRRQVATAPTPVVVVDAVKLVEAGFDATCDEVWVVTAQPAQQVERLMRRNGLARHDAEARVAAQPPLGPKLRRATRVVDNSADLSSTLAQVDAGWVSLAERFVREQPDRAGKETR